LPDLELLLEDDLEPEDLDLPLEDDLLTLRPLDERETDLPDDSDDRDDLDAFPDDFEEREDLLVFPEDLYGAREDELFVRLLDRDTPLELSDDLPLDDLARVERSLLTSFLPDLADPFVVARGYHSVPL
jgi:hypothetical protein